MTSITSTGFELVDWQRDAVEAWKNGSGRPHRGTLEIFTGGGKSLVALECIAAAAEIDPDLKVAIVAPTEALARQWIGVVTRHTDLRDSDIGLLGGGSKDSLDTHRVLVAVLNSAAKYLPEQARAAFPLMLVVDECHRAGAPTFSRVLDTEAPYRLGLSATPDREEFDDDGEPLEFDEQLVGRLLGPVVYRFGLRDARKAGWLPDYELHHHGLTLHPAEREEYDRLSRRVDDAADDLRNLGGETSRARQLRGRADELGKAAGAYVTLTAQRKDMLYRVAERGRVAGAVAARSLKAGPRKILFFHERVDDATALRDQLAWMLPEVGVALEHSRLPDSERVAALEDFRSGASTVLVSVKSLIEGIDVPDAEVGISVASSSSVRQRVQSIGRVLRRSFDPAAPTKKAEMHLLYVSDTVDEVIYEKEDWADLTGEGANHYWLWSLDPDARPIEQGGPPASPRPSEDAEWQRLGAQMSLEPMEWHGSYVGQEYSVDTLGTVTNRWGAVIANPQGVDEMVRLVRGRPGGRFRVSPIHRLVLVTRGDGEGVVMVAGQLAQPFEAVEDDTDAADVDVDKLQPGDVYPGPVTKGGGSFKLRQKRGGVIERKAPDGGLEFALVGPEGGPLADNAERILDAWRAVLGQGVTFHVNEADHAWYTEGGDRRFLAAVPGGFAWPSAEEN